MFCQPEALGNQAPRGWGWLLTDFLSLSHPALMAHVPPLSPPPLCCTLAISQLSLDQVILVCSPPAPLPPFLATPFPGLSEKLLFTKPGSPSPVCA